MASQRGVCIRFLALLGLLAASRRRGLRPVTYGKGCFHTHSEYLGESQTTQSSSGPRHDGKYRFNMGTGEWQGNITLTLVIIALVICFAWIPVVAIISLFHNGRVRMRAFAERRGWMQPPPDEEKRIAQQQKAPWVQRPPPAFPNPSPRAIERTVSSSRTRRDSTASWDPIRRWETVSSSNDPPAARPSSAAAARSNFSRPMPSRASSVRSTTSAHHPSGQSRSRRPSTHSAPPDMPPVAFQINDTYYDTTPLPENRPSSGGSAYAKPNASRSQSRASRSHSQASAGSSSHSRRGTSLDVARRNVGRDSDDPFWQRPVASSSTELPPSFSPPPRRGSLHAQAFERPAWLDDQPHAM
ncbi:hypothetical protein B0T16DRAFT_393919 [Cercophora newfieldiana]|uniref:Uncharacterized protein n=1 Tax=Cercophora newfieldiana TaxID=92897 RepID=A0AA39XWR2_9PEZI|nr:hypothetical protein B0T16DRAFT_393919 [Cercophora newfieldiana]